MKSVIKDIIFVFGNPITRIQSMATEYDISVIGTNTPSRLIKELETANDVSQYFFIVTDEEELQAVNNMFKRLVGRKDGQELNMFVIIDKRYSNKLRVGRSGAYVRDFQELTESVITDLVFSTAVHNQVQYFTERPPETTTIMTKEKMDRLARTLNSMDNQNVLQSIKTQFGEVKEMQDKLSVSKMILNTKNTGVSYGDIKIDTQEFLIEKINEIKGKLAKVNSREDLEDLMAIMLELLNMRSGDLKESSAILINKILDEELRKGKEISEESKRALEEIELSLLDDERKEIDTLVERRNKYMSVLKQVEEEVNDRVEAVRAIASNYLRDIKEVSFEMLTGEYGNYLSTESKIEFQETYNNNSLAIKESTIALVETSHEIIQDLQQVVKKYNNLMKLDTSIIESQQRLVETLTTQKVVERVEYSNPLTVKLNLLVSPTPNLGVSTMFRVFEHKWKKILALDFREIISNPEGYSEMEYSEFMTRTLDELVGDKIKVNVPLAANVDEEELQSRLQVVESEFDVIFVIVDKYMTLGIDLDFIQRIIYLSDTNERNLLEVNKLVCNYEPLFDNLNKRMFILNKMTYLKKQDSKNLLITAGIEPTVVKVNMIDLSVELIDGDSTEYKNINAQFNYF